MRWFVVELSCEHEVAEVVEDRLQSLGAKGVESIDKTELTAYLSRPESLDYASESFLESLPERVEIKAWFQIGESEDEVYIREDHESFAEVYEDDPLRLVKRSRLLDILGNLVENLKAAMEQDDVCKLLGSSVEEEEDWSEKWKEHYEILHPTPRLVIKPSWLDYEVKPGEQVLDLDPGSAFGTGYHESTSLCLAYLDEIASREEEFFTEAEILDLGCGSGILGIAAAKLGAKNVEAIDIDPQAAKVAKENFIHNGLENIPVRQGELRDCDKSYDFILANLIAKLHIQFASDYALKLKTDGLIMLSGIIEDRAEEVRKAMIESGFILLDQRMRREWWTMIWRLKSSD